MKKNKQKSWTIILTDGPQSPVRKFNLSKKLFYSSILIVFFLIITIGGLTYTLNKLNMEQSQLYAKIDQQQVEITEVKNENIALHEEASAVQETIEEFKSFEARLSEMDLEMPSDLDDRDGSGGIELPEGLDVGDEYNDDVFKGLLEMRDNLPELLDSFEDTLATLMEYEEELRTVPTLFPAEEGRISSHYGNREDPITQWKRFHSGTDIAAPLETRIYAAADGTVIHAGRHGGYGKTVIIDHGSTYETLYAHLNSIEVSVGDTVKKGDDIAGMGTTGRSTGVHLHYEIKRNGEHIDPYIYMTFHQR
ncbi:peptidoglycan DD-metalloendopeptidase family protein [Bacillus shivajii]|uniref:peptidoglycan DD-metalloendopeptidase family protein n=1 Tax=Bacillus shivajii TaxID=1983719 RepID=UPI001CFC16B3|nr:peptidoglycan DD-metalloendopeptidase family protein [Bacillus shivajii]UCZ53879.1 peptidoglycan DD-metalloendopeptidase family protein [Bacillus shivajii]